MADPKTRLPLFPLADEVHFPRTELKLVLNEPRYLRMVQDLMEKDDEDRWIGVVLLKPGWAREYEGRPDVYPEGTAGRLLDVDNLPDGRTLILLVGDFRFELEREVVGREPYRLAEVRPVEEPWLNERDAGIQAVRKGVAALLRRIADETGEKFPMSSDEIEEITGECAFEELVNRVAAGLDLPPLRKLKLLQQPLPDRGLSVLSILRNRHQVFELLRPWRHLASHHEKN
ncbi:MAG TPA: LON peptidase substrate-binding domain-containing protein [Thermoanaerobaculia bacterium]|jgi:Lon protease-like protein|nr:LON peptidase substrate-binding domain-containing protein [Thermoanaerobaculia bacterium]